MSWGRECGLGGHFYSEILDLYYSYHGLFPEMHLSATTCLTVESNHIISG